MFPFPHINDVSSIFDYDPIFDFIGHGAFADVFKAKKLPQSNEKYSQQQTAASAPLIPTGMEVALKIISKLKVQSQRDINDIINEVELLRQVNHPHCVKLYEVWQTSNDIIIVLNLVKNSDELFRAITHGAHNGGGVLQEQSAAKIMYQLLQALTYLHDEKRIVHRDLKPENILISNINSVDDVAITIVDFGLAKFFGSGKIRKRPRKIPIKGFGNGNGSGSIPLSSTNYLFSGSSLSSRPSRSSDSLESQSSAGNSPVLTTPCGTLKYSAPETIRGLLENGEEPRKTTRAQLPKIDCFSLGIIAYVMLSGSMPWNDKLKAALALAMERGVAFHSPRWDTISVEAKDFVSRLLDPDPSTRLGAADAMKHPWIQQYQAAGPLPSHSSCFLAEEDVARSGCVLDEMVADREQVSSFFDVAMSSTAAKGTMTEEEEEESATVRSILASEVPRSAMYPPPPVSLAVPSNSLITQHNPASLISSYLQQQQQTQQQPRHSGSLPSNQSFGSTVSDESLPRQRPKIFRAQM